MKYALPLFLSFFIMLTVYATPADDLRGKVGSVFAAPILVNDNYYFVATTGVLYESNKNFSKITKLFEGKRQTTGHMTFHEDKFYWGDGLHTDRKTNFHVFDLKTKKLLKDLELPGHIERPVTIHQGQIFLPLGPAGIMSLDLRDLKIIWHSKQHEGKDLHVDSNILVVEDKVCGTSVYTLKGVICFDLKSGKITQFQALKRNPKSEITLWKNHIVGFATDADMVTLKFDIPADFYVYDVKADKFSLNKELRGFNFFAPFIEGDSAFITLSTGDFITMNLNDGKIYFLGEFPEPFINNSFMKGSEYCGIGIMGKLMCYSKIKSAFALSTDKRLLETVIGKVSMFDAKMIIPTRVGYVIE